MKTKTRNGASIVQFLVNFLKISNWFFSWYLV